MLRGSVFAILIFSALSSLLAGCGGALPSNSAVAPLDGAPLGTSWFRSDAKSTALLYETNGNDGTVHAYSYPSGTLEGELTGFKEPYGACTDKMGNVWIVDDEASSITQYAHGASKPTRTLSDSGEYPAGCSVDPATGNLAVMNYETTARGQGGISIYRKAKGSPKSYSDPSISRGWFCSYDNRGNLIVDGYRSGSSGFQLAELPHGAATLTNISVNQTITVPGGVQWNGPNVAVADENGPGNGVIYQFSISGSSGTKVSTTTLDSSQNVHQFWIDPAGNRVVVPSASLGTVGYWDFPTGGYPTKTIGGLNIPEAVALSRARK